VSLDANVIPGVCQVIATLVPAGNQVPSEVSGGATGAPTAPLKGLSYGPRLSIPWSPWAWLQNSSMSTPEPRGDSLTPTTWMLVLRLLYKWVPDQPTAERALSALIEPLRAAFRLNTMLLPQPNPNPIRRTYVSSGEWGYAVIDEVLYRYLDLNVTVSEKEAQSYLP
jgi:hypothetical protein